MKKVVVIVMIMVVLVSGVVFGMESRLHNDNVGYWGHAFEDSDVVLSIIFGSQRAGAGFYKGIMQYSYGDDQGQVAILTVHFEWRIDYNRRLILDLTEVEVHPSYDDFDFDFDAPINSMDYSTFNIMTRDGLRMARFSGGFTLINIQ